MGRNPQVSQNKSILNFNDFVQYCYLDFFYAAIKIINSQKYMNDKNAFLKKTLKR